MSVRKYAGKRGATWHVVLEMGKDPETGKRRQEILREDPETGLLIRTKRRAEEIEREALVELRKGGVVIPNTTPLRVYLVRWLRETAHEHSVSTHYNYITIVHKRIIPALGDVPIGHLSAIQLQRFLRDLQERYAHNTVQTTRGVLASALSQAVRWRVIAQNPLHGIRLKRSSDVVERVAWTPEEVRSFLKQTEASPWQPLWRLLLDSGMRVGEALALTWDDLDMEVRSVRVSKTRSIINERGQRGTVNRTKTASGRRTINLSPTTIKALRRHKTAQIERRLATGEYWFDLNVMFDRGDGEHLKPAEVWKQFKHATAAAHMPEQSTTHTLRHTCATIAVATGQPLHAVKERLGHANIAITANLYAHASPDADKRLSEALARAVEG